MRSPAEFVAFRCEQDQPGDDRPRVLVADDNADMRQYIARLLAKHYRVDAADQLPRVFEMFTQLDTSLERSALADRQ